MSEKFEYSTFDLIEAVENNICLWDNTDDSYANEISKYLAWQEVCVYLEPNFETFLDTKKDKIRFAIIKKWNNLKDTFMESLKHDSEQFENNICLYSDKLQFLSKTFKADDLDDTLSTLSFDSTSAVSDDTSSPSSSRKRKLESVEEEIVKDSQQDEYENMTDDDKLFLCSILPTVKRIHKDDKIRFRIEVLKLVQKYFTQHSQTLATSSAIGNNKDQEAESAYLNLNQPNEVCVPEAAVGAHIEISKDSENQTDNNIDLGNVSTKYSNTN